MPNDTNVPPLSFHPETVAAAAQNRLACLSRAWTQMAHGMMAAGIAQMDVARSLYTTPSDFEQVFRQQNPTDAAHQWLNGTQARFNTALKQYRAINDELAKTVFSAAETLVDGLTADSDAVMSAVRSGTNGALAASAERPKMRPSATQTN